MVEGENTATGADQTKTLLPVNDRITIGEDTYTVGDFCVAKTMRALSYVAALAQATGVLKPVEAAATAGVPASSDPDLDFLDQAIPDEQPAAVSVAAQPQENILVRILRTIPTALADGQKPLYRVLGLIVTKNRDLRLMDENEEDIDDKLFKVGRGLAYDGSLDDIMRLIELGVSKVGIDTIIKNAPSLATLLKLS